MCWIGKCDVKVAKRDFYVYKVGSVFEGIFRSLYQSYVYKLKELNKEIKIKPVIHDYDIYKLKKEHRGIIYEGYHSYKDISMPYSELGSYSRVIYLGKLAGDLRLYNPYYIATFIIPKGSEYYENDDGEIVSSNIIYTGKCVKIGTLEL